MLGVVWIGGLGGGFAGLLLSYNRRDLAALVAIIATTANDIGAYVVGRALGTRPFSDISPGKTVEGLVGGGVITLIVVVLLVGVFPQLKPFDSAGPRPPARHLRGRRGSPRRPVPVGRQAGPGRQGHGHAAPRPRRGARPVRRHAVRPARHLLPASALKILGASTDPRQRRPPMTTTVALAGSTGSIGTQTLDVVAAEPERYRIVALGASGRNVEPCVAQVRAVRPEVVAVDDDSHLDRAQVASCRPARCGRAPARLASLGAEADVCVNGVVGFAGLRRHPGHARSRQAPGAGQQGVADRRRPGGAAGPAHARRRAGAGRQRALRHPPVPAQRRPRRAPPGGRAGAHRQRRTVPGPHPRRAGSGHRRRRAGPPHLEDGPEDHRRLRRR